VLRVGGRRRLAVVFVTAALVAIGVPTAAGAAVTGATPLSARTAIITLSRDHGPIGTTVRFHGHVKKADATLYEGYINQFLSGTMKRRNGETCSAEVALSHTHSHFNRRTGAIRGRFTIGRLERCAPTVTKHERSRRTQAGKYTLSIGCVSCDVGAFTITHRRALTIHYRLD
jgi:hypothetical protein